MKALLIPVKESANAKQRLAPHFSSVVRAELATAFWKDFFDVVARSRGFDAVFVVSSHAPAPDRAREFGWQTIVESEQRSESASVDFASEKCEQMGVTALLRMPVDLPLIEPRDIEEILACTPAAPAALIVPAADGDGTNALLRTPPTLFRSHFGPNSFRKHRDAASECAAHITTLRNPRIEVDVDTLEDLRRIALSGVRGGRTKDWLLKYCQTPAAVAARASIAT